MSRRPTIPRGAKSDAVLAIVVALVSAEPCIGFAQTARLMGAPVYTSESAPTGGRAVAVDLSGPGAAVRTLQLPKGKSAVVELPTDAQDVLVSDPKVADVVLSTRRRIYVLGLASGQTDAAFVDASGRQILRLNIRVDQDVSALGDTLNRLLPGSTIRAEPVNDSIVLSGEVANLATADKAVRIASSFVSKPEQVVNMLSIAESEQVMLKVKVIEVNRSVIKQLGFNLSEVMGQLGKPQYLFGTTATWGINGSLLGGATGGYKFDSTYKPTPQSTAAGVDTSSTVANGHIGSSGVNSAQALVNAFERVGLVKTLAEQTLTSVSGEPAKFLAGGEFPVPVAVDNTGRISAEFKPYGVGLGFTPVVMSSGRISIKMSTEVSELTSNGAFTLAGNGTTLSLPGLNVRRAENVTELNSGGALMIAGLLQSQTKQTLDSLPGLMQVPVVGALFRSRDFLNNETELAIIVEAYLVKPVRPDQLQTPADGLQVASDLDTNLLGRLNSGFGKTPPKAPGVKTYQGPYGYVVD